MGTRSIRNSALALAAQGFFVFPLRSGSKVPALRRDWERAATTLPEQISGWWRHVPFNIGVAAGPSGLAVLDLDRPKAAGGSTTHGRDVLAALLEQRGASLPRTFTVGTASGGDHLYFRSPTGVRLRNSAGRLGQHIDTRAAGGYVVGPGSVVGGIEYKLIDDAPPAPMPSWLVAALTPPAPTLAAGPRELTANSPYVRSAIVGESALVHDPSQGSRNHVLFRAAARLGRFVLEGALTEREVADALTAASLRHVGVHGFTAAEVARTIRSGLRAAHESVAPRRPTRRSDSSARDRGR